jgi:adenylate cyclase
LFSEVGRALQASTDLDEMLETLLSLIFMQVPADFALIGSIDPETNEVIPKVVRQAETGTSEGATVSRTVIRSALAARSAFVVNDVVQDALLNEAVSLRQHAVHSVMCVPLHHEGRIHGVIYLDTRNRQVAFEERHLEIVTAMALFSAVAIEQFGLRAKTLEQQRQRERLVRYIDAAVAERVIAAGDQVPMIADKEEVTVLFSDLKGFTTLSEKLAPNDVVDVLNLIFGRLTEAVFHHQGTLDKFMGDGMMAFFGAPLRSPDHARQAVRAAREMLAALNDFNRGRPSEPPIGIRIGINTGPVIVGDIGSRTRKDYTVIGDTVNVASRLESSVAKTNEIVVGPATRAALGDEFVCEQLPPQTLKGRIEPIQPFRVLDSKAGGSPG